VAVIEVAMVVTMDVAMNNGLIALGMKSDNGALMIAGREGWRGW
jgi:hypothetical protein